LIVVASIQKKPCQAGFFVFAAGGMFKLCKVCSGFKPNSASLSSKVIDIKLQSHPD
jgi:hypothetical protein